jgi:hypothetical protein
MLVAGLSRLYRLTKSGQQESRIIKESRSSNCQVNQGITASGIVNSHHTKIEGIGVVKRTYGNERVSLSSLKGGGIKCDSSVKEPRKGSQNFHFKMMIAFFSRHSSRRNDVKY